nr:golgin family A protein [Ipomoea batatas]
MPRQNRVGMEGLVPKVRKRGCSSSSSASSRVHNYRFKRAIVVGKGRNGLGLGGSRSSTPVPLWKTTPLLRPAVESPAASQAGTTSRPVSARKLAATLWEMNEVPSPRIAEEMEQRKKKKMAMMMMMTKKEKIMRSGHSGSDSVSGSLPPHLCDPSHSPVSERFDRSGTGSYQKRASTTSHRPRPVDHNVGVLDSLSSASLMEMDTRSRASVSVVGVKNRLKDISNALITSKELLKIINRIWANADPPSSSMSLVSALHTELERARLQVNQLIQEQSSDQSEIDYLIKCFAEEKAAWKNKERAAIESIANELEVERKLRRRCENLNGKLGKELSEAKASFVKVVKELENEKRAREMIEQVCNDLARDIGEDRVEVEELKRDSAKVQEEIEKEREMLQIADKLREERAHMKLSEAKHQFEEKSSAVDKLRKQLESFLGKKKSKRKGNVSTEEKMAACSNKTPITSHRNTEKEDDGGEMANAVDYGEESAESDLHSIELNMENTNKNPKAAYPSAINRESKRVSADEIKVRNSLTGQVPRRSSTLLRTISDAVDWGTEAGNIQNPGDGTNHGLDWERLHELDKLGKRYAYAEEIQRIKAIAGMKNHTLPVSSPSRLWDQPRSSRDPGGTPVERSGITHESTLIKSRLADMRGEERSVTRSKR